MASRNYEKRQRKKLKAAQAEKRYVEALRREALNYEGVYGRNVLRMSKERLEEVVRRGKRRKGITGAPIGLPLALAAAALLRSR